MDMDVYQPRRYPKTSRVHAPSAFGRWKLRLNSGDPAITEQHVKYTVAIAGGIDYAAEFQKKLFHRVASDSRIGSTIE